MVRELYIPFNSGIPSLSESTNSGDVVPVVTSPPTVTFPAVEVRYTSLTAASLRSVCRLPSDFSVIAPLSFVPFPFASRSVTVWSVPFAFLFSTLILPLTTGWMESASLSALSSTKTWPWMGAFASALCTVMAANWLPVPCKFTSLALTAVTFCAWMPAVVFWLMPA